MRKRSSVEHGRMRSRISSELEENLRCLDPSDGFERYVGKGGGGFRSKAIASKGPMGLWLDVIISDSEWEQSGRAGYYRRPI